MRLVVVNTDTPGTFVSLRPETSMPEFDGETYPETTDVLCWHCCHPFEGRPLPMPISYSDSEAAFRVYGVFCSFGCMHGYLRDNRGSIPGCSGATIGMTVFDFFKKMTGCQDPRKVPKAPPRCLLKTFGGYMTLEEFRGASTDFRDFARLPPKCILAEQVYHERKMSTSHMNSVGHQWQRISSSNNTHNVPMGETLKMKRKYQDSTFQISTATKKKTILEQALGIA